MDLRSEVAGSLLAEIGDKTRWLTLTDQAVVSIASFAASVIIGRLCGAEQLGLYVLSQTLIGLVAEFQEVLVWSPYTFFSSRLVGRDLQLYTGGVLLHQLALSLLALPPLLVLAAGGPWTRGLAALKPVVWTLLGVGTFICFQEFTRRVCFAGLQTGAALGFDSLASVLRIGGLVLLAWLGRLSAATAVLVLGAAGGLAGLLWLFWARKRLAFSWLATVGAWRQNVSFGKWMLGSNLALLVSQHALPWFLAACHDLHQLGLLAACQGVLALTNPLFAASRNYLAPQAARVFVGGHPARRRRFVRLNTLIISAAVGGLCLFLMGFGNHLLHLFYGPQYGDQRLVIALLAVQVMLTALPLVLDYGIWAMGRPDVNWRINLFRLAVALTAGLALVSRLGLLGAVLGYLLTSAVVLALQTLSYIKLARAQST
jgi:O-antigen/teichoic acid export membrane protein